MKRALVLIPVIVTIALLGGCVGTQAPEWYPESLAILPFTNETADFDINLFARYAMYQVLVDRGYPKVMPLEEVDKRLDKLGITEGGQLPTVSNEELMDALDTDCVLYGNVLTAKRVNLGIYLKREFSCAYTMNVTATGLQKWEASNISKASDLNLSLSDAVGAAVGTLAHDAISRGFKSHPLYEQIHDVTIRSARAYPNWRMIRK